MKKVKDFKFPYRAKPRWASNNPEALAITCSDLLDKSWSDATSAVRKEGKGVILLSDSELTAIMIPVNIMQEFYDKAPDLKDVDIVGYVSEIDLKNDFDNYRSRLMSGENLIVLDESEAQLFAIACRKFSSVLETDENGVVKFRENTFDDDICDLSDDILNHFTI